MWSVLFIFYRMWIDALSVFGVLDEHTRNPGAQNQRDKGEEDSYRNHPPCLFDFHTHKVDGDGIE